MRVLFTGASSFTGFWFVRELACAGHEVVATFRRGPDEYADEPRRTRCARLVEYCRPVHGCTFGDDLFVNLVRDAGPWDLFCHHAADVTNYKSPDFDVHAAVANNTRNLDAVLDALRSAGCRRVLLTGSVFEPHEGAGSQDLPAFSPYGLSKGLTAEIFRYHTAIRDMRLGKFVIPNPFGPYEEPRFTMYLVRHWREGKTPVVNTPAYVRDNIPVSLLAKAYVRFAQSLGDGPGFQKTNPSGYVESQGAFAQRFAAEMASRLGIPCPLDLRRQTEFTEPRVRLNTDLLDAAELGWDESLAWDELADYYRGLPK
ncbi:MAG TPA: NAD(P)-dependent oxidoreductase [Phycisphaerae bacterium]|nr:NAD(P)-dependent oxidoreductase [Phycisphaerae bacterium]HOJ73038.1 NAD(P)-dependent oxidoreductase [Phycisphaerae bacterium]HOM52655.1 NAD(P)-dependent oxidoreductase [Phycisphaerae bacterium]HON68320.1 NAD(P)-dependent oxidoreductase [Phycisphaerae bacterium]HOQ87799.1 NAD(P)-dependent oxidoreductase [Phycisphaerae bacterium]